MNYIEEWIIDYEQKHGRKPSETTVEIVRHIVRVGDMLKKHGEEDGRKGKRRYVDEAFPQFVWEVFGMGPDVDIEVIQAIADVWKGDYMEGYREGSAM